MYWGDWLAVWIVVTIGWYGYKEDDEFLDSDVPDTDK